MVCVYGHSNGVCLRTQFVFNDTTEYYTAHVSSKRREAFLFLSKDAKLFFFFFGAHGRWQISGNLEGSQNLAV